MDVESLRIDRSGNAGRVRPAGRRGGPNWWAWGFVAALLGAGWLFRGPLVGMVDRARLPKVRTLQVSASHPAAVGAVRGAASNGYVVAARRAALSADTPGRIVEMNVTEGSKVKQGDVVARLFAEEYSASLARAEADVQSAQARAASAQSQVALARARVAGRQRLAEAAAASLGEARAGAELARVRLQRTQDLVATQVRAQDALDEVQALERQTLAQVEAARAREAAAGAEVADAERQVDVALADAAVAKAQVDVAAANRLLAQATLGKTAVRAPFDGIVVLKDAEVGEVVSPNSQGGSNARGAVCTLVDFASLEVQAEVPETTLAAVTIGADADVFLDAFPDQRHAGRVDRIWPTANRQKATVEVRIKLLAPDERMRPEMGVRVVFRSEAATDATPATSAPQILIPETAVIEVQGRSGVFALERDVAKFQPVEVGQRKGGRAEIKSGLRAGQRIVLDPPVELKDGDRVLVAEGT